MLLICDIKWFPLESQSTSICFLHNMSRRTEFKAAVTVVSCKIQPALNKINKKAMSNELLHSEQLCEVLLRGRN